MSVRRSKKRNINKLLLKAVAIYLSTHLIILSSACSSTSSYNSLQSTHLNTSKKNIPRSFQNDNVNSVREIKSPKEQDKQVDLKDYDTYDKVLLEKRFLIELENRFSEPSNGTKLNILNNQVEYVNMNKTSGNWLKLISDYFVLSENLTTYLGIQHGLNGFHIENQTLHHNLTKDNPILILSNFSQNANITFKFDTNYFTNLNSSILSKIINQNVSIENVEFIYPPWNNLNKTEQEKFLQLAQGSSQRHGEGTSIGLTIYFLFLLCFGIPGNLATCCIILTNSYMRTAPNLFLLNIAIADIFTLILVIPLELTMIWKSYPWPLGDFGCDLATVISELASHVLIVTMISFSIERYFAICHPLKPSLQLDKKGTTILILMIWLLCLLPSISWSIYSQVEYLYYSTVDDPKYDIDEAEDSLNGNNGHFLKIEESAMCKMSPKSVTSAMVVMTGVTSGFLYILPIIILPFIYQRISSALKTSESFNRPLPHSGDMIINRKAVIRMQMAVIICFLICWTPYHLQRIMFVVVTKKDTWNNRIFDIQDTLHMVAACCYFLSPVLNPFLYCLLSKRFRRGFNDLKMRMTEWWKANIWPTQSSSSQESSSKANFVARPFMSLPNPSNPSHYQVREETKNAFMWNTEGPTATMINVANNKQKYKRRQLAVEMNSVANTDKEKNDSEISSSDDDTRPKLSNNNSKDSHRLFDNETSNCFSQDDLKSIKLKCKAKLLIKSPSFNPETFLSINEKTSLVNEKAINHRFISLFDLPSIKRTRSLINV